jgi:hypothetical protein
MAIDLEQHNIEIHQNRELWLEKPPSGGYIRISTER